MYNGEHHQKQLGNTMITKIERDEEFIQWWRSLKAIKQYHYCKKSLPQMDFMHTMVNVIKSN